jgi:hypothetical protein
VYVVPGRLGQQDAAGFGFFRSMIKVDSHSFENRGQVQNFSRGLTGLCSLLKMAARRRSSAPAHRTTASELAPAPFTEPHAGISSKAAFPNRRDPSKNRIEIDPKPIRFRFGFLMHLRYG